EFYIHGAPTKLSVTLASRASAAGKSACVLTFPSRLVLSPPLIEAALHCHITIRYLYGSAADCINSFLHREHETGRNLPVEHWLANNGGAYLQISRPELSAYRIIAFTKLGERVSLSRLASQLIGGA